MSRLAKDEPAFDHAVSGTEEAGLYHLTIAPNAPASPWPMRLVVLSLAAISFMTGLAFWHLGAWPIIGFFGLDILLVILAFRLSARRMHYREEVRVGPEDLQVAKIAPSGQTAWWRLPTAWTQVRLIDDGPRGERLVLSSHGQGLALADCLIPDERKRVAEALKSALNTVRA
jgi:uncharacterized membrane protein